MNASARTITVRREHRHRRKRTALPNWLIALMQTPTLTTKPSKTEEHLTATHGLVLCACVVIGVLVITLGALALQHGSVIPFGFEPLYFSGSSQLFW